MARYTNPSKNASATYTPIKMITKRIVTSSTKISLALAITKIVRIKTTMTLTKKQQHSIIFTNQQFNLRMIQGMDELWLV